MGHVVDRRPGVEARIEFATGAPHLLKGEMSENVGRDVDSHAVRQPLGTYTETGWEVFPQGLTDTLTWIRKRYGDIPQYVTENGAAFSPEILARFDAVVFNNVSGDVFTPDQRAALRSFIENGGGFVSFHGSGGDMSYDWQWYVNDLIGAQFTGHPMDPQFQQATLHVEDASHPASAMAPNTQATSGHSRAIATNPSIASPTVAIMPASAGPNTR